MSDSIPAESELPTALTSREQWCCWQAEKRDGKMTKVPIDPASGSFASTTNSATWSDFETAAERVRAGDVSGLGFVFTDGDPIVGVDLDDCRIRKTGETREWATDIMDRLDSFTEISPSGTGYHVLVEGSLPDGRNRKDDIELYETARFFTVTGDHVEDTPSTVESRETALFAIYQEYLCEAANEAAVDNTGEQRLNNGQPMPGSSLTDQALIERAKAAANGEKFGRLWRGSTAGYESHSEADMALCSLLAFWTGGDASQMDRLFRESGLHRVKWDERHFADGSTYGEKTIERAIAGTDDFYEPSGRMPDGESSADGGADGTGAGKPDSARLKQLERLEAELREAIDETERLRAELAAERERRRELETQLDRARENAEERKRGWVPW